MSEDAESDARLDGRLTDLEIRYTHQTDLVDQLSEIVREQQTSIDRLLKAVKVLQDQVTDQAADEVFPHEKPPHY